MPETNPRDELAVLTQALHAHLDALTATGAIGLSSAPSPERAQPREMGQAVAAPRSAAQPRAEAPVSQQRDGLPAAPLAASTARGTDDPTIRQRLEVLNAEVRECTRCGLHRDRKQAVFARGTGRSGICFVGEGPGADEDEQGYPFVGKAGQLLDRMITAMGFERDDVYVCNIVKCRPPKNRKPELDEMTACVPYLKEQLELLRPRVIVALGATAVQGLLGTSGGITRMRGNWKLYQGEIDVMPTFHPAYLLRQPSAKRQVWEDLQAVLNKLGLPVPENSRRGSR